MPGAEGYALGARGALGAACPGGTRDVHAPGEHGGEAADAVDPAVLLLLLLLERVERAAKPRRVPAVDAPAQAAVGDVRAVAPAPEAVVAVGARAVHAAHVKGPVSERAVRRRRHLLLLLEQRRRRDGVLPREQHGRDVQGPVRGTPRRGGVVRDEADQRGARRYHARVVLRSAAKTGIPRPRVPAPRARYVHQAVADGPAG
mmetsp:Transcript_16099/g.62558  ORF Transcript_16099/g.62558 Transcript_16099/m.62558 type:complete len:202 (+) Transcript_16099:878-1483(+)